MANREVLANPANAPQPVQWWIASYYPTDAAGQAATTAGTLFKTYNDAVEWGRTTLAAAGVGMVLMIPYNGVAMYPLFDPEPN